MTINDEKLSRANVDTTLARWFLFHDIPNILSALVPAGMATWLLDLAVEKLLLTRAGTDPVTRLRKQDLTACWRDRQLNAKSHQSKGRSML